MLLRPAMRNEPEIPMKIQLQTPFKGPRHYIHGTDIFNGIENRLKTLEPYAEAYVSQLALHRFAYHVCELVLEVDSPIATYAAKGELSWPDGSKKAFYVVETEVAPDTRVPYDEEAMVSRAEYEGHKVRLDAPIPHSTIEAVIALTKVLNYRLNPPRTGKWIFGRIDLVKPLPSITSSVQIEQAQALPGRFSKNAIVVDDEPVGTIQFIVGNP
jgi:hypothetical protein